MHYSWHGQIEATHIRYIILHSYTVLGVPHIELVENQVEEWVGEGHIFPVVVIDCGGLDLQAAIWVH